MTPLINHSLQLLTGMGSGVICLLLLQVLGMLATPTRAASGIATSPRSAMIGAAIATLWCWYGVQLDFPLPQVMTTGACVLLFAAVCRFSFLARLIGNKTTGKQWLAALAVFALCYTATYGFLPPSSSKDFLPIARYGNNDILNYINYTNFLHRLEPTNVAGYEFRRTGYPVYEATPTAFYAISAISSFFSREPISAAMPALFTTAAVIGCAFAWLSRMAFGLPRVAAAAIALALLCGPFFRYLVGNYFLSQLIGGAIVLLLLGETTRLLAKRHESRLWMVVGTTLPFHIVLLFTYIPLWVIGASLQVGFVFIYTVITLPSLRRNDVLLVIRTTLIWAAAGVCGIIAGALAAPDRFWMNLTFTILISKAGVGGWSLDFISPFTILGAPTPLQVLGSANHATYIVAYTAFLLVLGWLLLSKRRLASTPEGIALYVIAALASVLYFAYFLLVGPSYQQWKLASYLPLTMSFAVLAASATLMITPASVAAEKHALRYRAATTVLALLIVSNVARHIAWEPRPERFSSSYANLRSIEKLDGVESVFVNMASYSSTFFPIYFIRNKLLHLTSQSYYPQQSIDLDKISPATPLLQEGDVCAPDAFQTPVSGVGCLFFRRPTLAPDHKYKFVLPEGVASLTGVSAAESWGRWSDGKTVKIKLFANDADVSNRPSAFLNLELLAFLPTPRTGQTVMARWGNGQHARATVSANDLISIPIEQDDWTSGNIRTLTLTLDLPDAISPSALAETSLDTRVLAIGFKTMSWTNRAAGRIVADE